jgi:hypothetical protein
MAMSFHPLFSFVRMDGFFVEAWESKKKILQKEGRKMKKMCWFSCVFWGNRL